MSETATSGQIERQSFKSQLFERAQALLPEGQNVRWAFVEGLPARDGHPGLGFKGFAEFMEHRMGGMVLLQSDPKEPENMTVTFMAKPGEKMGRPISKKSQPEIAGGDSSEQFDGLQVTFRHGPAPYKMIGFHGQEPVEVEGLYGSSVSATAPDAELFASACLKALERSAEAQAAANTTTQ